MLHVLLLLIIASPGHAWSNDARSYPSNDATDEEKEADALEVQSSTFEMQLYHPWTTNATLTPRTIKSAQQTVESVLDEVLSNHFSGAYLPLPSTDGAVRIGQYQSIDADLLPTDELETLVKENNASEDTPQCPCSTISLRATAYFALISAISPSFGSRRIIEESDNATTADDDDDDDDSDLLTTFLDDLISTLLESGSPGALRLESELQTAVAFFSEGQGFAVRIILLVDERRESFAPSSAHPSSAPTPMPTKTSVLQAPPLRSSSSPAPTPTFGIINGVSSASSARSAGSGERAIFLIGAILGACFFAAAFLLLRKAEIRRNIVEQHKSSNDPTDSIEEIEFYPNHLRPTPPSYTSAYTENDNTSTRLPGCMSMELSSEYLFNNQVKNVYSDTTPKASNKAKVTMAPRSTKYDALDTQSQSCISPPQNLFEVKSFDDLDPLQPPSAVFAKRQCKVVEPLQPSSTSFSILDSVWSSFDGWSTCSSWPSNNSSSTEKLQIVDEITDIRGATGHSPENPSITEISEPAETKLPTASVAAAQTVGIDPPGTVETKISNDDGSFHGSVESFDSLISSCWDPNDNSTSDAIPEGLGPPAAESSSTTSVLADDVSFYPHIKFMSNPKMLQWAERAKKSLAVVHATKVGSSGSSVESLVTTAADQMASDEKLSGEHPYLSVSFSNSTESSFDENGFKVVNNLSTLV